MMINRDTKKAKPKAPEPFPTPDEHTTTKKLKPGSFAAVAASMMAAQRKQRELANGR
jgi:hypothetical protein